MIEETAALKEVILKAFNAQFGTTLTAEQTLLNFNRATQDYLAVISLMSKAPGDNIRLYIQVKKFNYYTLMTPFEFGILPNYSAGDLKNETQISTIEIDQLKFPKIKKLLESKPFRDFSASSRQVRSAGGEPMVCSSGLSILTKRF